MRNYLDATPMPSVYALVIVLAGCTGPTPSQNWWEAEAPCPPGAQLHGEAPPPGTQVTEPKISGETSKFSNRSIHCGSGPGALERNGRSTSWHRNGQMSADAEMRGTTVIWLNAWDEWGRQTSGKTADSDSISETWWHSNGTKAVEGTTLRRQRDGTWTEWDEQGHKVGEIVFAAGDVKEVRLDTSPLLYSDPYEVVAAPNLPLPDSTSTTPLQLAIALNVSPGTLTVDGQVVRGADELGERLASKIKQQEQMFELTKIESAPGLLLLLNPTMPWSEVTPLLIVARDVGITEWQIVTTHVSGVRWPPRNALDRSRDPLPAFALTVGPEIIEREASTVQALVNGIQAP